MEQHPVYGTESAIVWLQHTRCTHNSDFDLVTAGPVNQLLVCSKRYIVQRFQLYTMRMKCLVCNMQLTQNDSPVDRNKIYTI